jgi:hypothetical protein
LGRDARSEAELGWRFEEFKRLRENQFAEACRQHGVRLIAPGQFMGNGESADAGCSSRRDMAVY